MEAESSPPSTSGPPLTLTDLNADTLAHCASFLSLQDVSNLAMSCKPLRRVAYSDAIWRSFFTKHWPFLCISSGAEGVREKYLDRHIAVNQLKFSDPVEFVRLQNSIPVSHMLLKKNEAFLAQGSVVTKVRLEFSKTENGCLEEILTGHNARITCMRLLPISDTTLFRSAKQNGEDVLVTSSSDRTIRIWWKGRSHRCFKGHNGPVLTLADRLLENDGRKVLASGGEDCTVRLWSVSGKHHPLLMTLHGHEKPVCLLSAAWHKPSLLVSMSTDSRVRVWDTASSSSSSSSCVGRLCVPGAPVGLKCYESLCYIAAGSSVYAIDIRTMRTVATVAKHPSKIYSFQMLPSKWLICTGGIDKALLWDIRKNQAAPQSIADMEHAGCLTMLHMDPYKTVTDGPLNHCANVWDTSTGILVNQLDCRVPGEHESIGGGLSAMAVDGCRIITNGCTTDELGLAYFRDYSMSSQPVSLSEYASSSKFWEPQQPSDDSYC